MSIEHGIQMSSSGSIKHGVQSPAGSEHDRRPNRGDKDTPLMPARNASKGSGGYATQVKGIRGQKGANTGSPKGKVSSFGGVSAGKAFQTKGFGGQSKGIR